MSKPKLVLIALDAADSVLVRSWAAEGHLPAIARLMRLGATAPIHTPPAVLEGGIWPTFLTSTSPATHGMFCHSSLVPGSYGIESAIGMRADRLGEPFWWQLGRAGKRIAIVDTPFARPLKRLNGIHVTNWGVHDEWCWSRSSWPTRLVGDLVARFGEHPAGNCDHRVRDDGHGVLRDRLIAGAQRKSELVRHCLAMEDWDFFLAVFSETHCAGHHLWHTMDSSHPQHDPTADDLLTALRDVYAAVDAALASVLESVPAEAHVLVMLSHGMGPFYAGSHLLDTLIERLGVNDAPAHPASAAAAAPSSRSAGSSLWKLRHVLPAGVRSALRTHAEAPIRRLWQWTHADESPRQHMRAFALPSHNMTGAIRINVKGREPAGLVAPGREYDDLCRELVEAMSALENVETGRRAVQWVKRVDELYRGPRLGDMPDVFVEWEHGAPIATVHSPRTGTVSQVYRPARTGDHREKGLLVGVGPRFVTSEVAAEVRTQDLAPTILDFFSVPAPPAFEGRSVLSSLGARTETLRRA